MANLRNEFEFRSALLTALGQEHTEAEAKNEEMWRRKMLDGLGVEYDQNDVNQFGLFREKLIEGVTNYSGGGGTKYETVFEGSVTTEASGDNARAIIQGYDLSAETIKVTFNGVEYTCPLLSDGSYGANYDDSTDETDWSEYPFYIILRGGALIVVTETAGTYSLKIEEPQSGGESDFSTAEVTVVNNSVNPIFINTPVYDIDTEFNDAWSSCPSSSPLPPNDSMTLNVIIYGYSAEMLIELEDRTVVTSNIVVTGDITNDGGFIAITGNGTITIS